MDHEAVKQVEAEGRGVVDGSTDGDACLCQVLHHGNHLRRGAARIQPAMGMLHIDVQHSALQELLVTARSIASAHLIGGVGVQTRGWLIQEKHTWLGH